MCALTRSLPKYSQLAETIRRQIASGVLPSNAQLPIEDELCLQHGVSRGTVREAIRLLIDEGLVRREQGRGTFVNEAQPESSLFSLSSFNEEMRRQNRQPETRVLVAETIAAADEIASRLELAPGAEVLHIERLRFADGQPVIYETRHLARHLCPGLLEEDLARESIHQILVRKCNIPLVKMVHIVEMRHPTEMEARLLHVSPATTLFSVDRLTYTLKNDTQIPAVWFRALYHQHAYSISATIQNSL